MIKTLHSPANGAIRNASLCFLLLTVLLLPRVSSAQTAPVISPDSIEYKGDLYKKVSIKPQYPRVVGDVSFILPLETLQSGSLTPNFDHHVSAVGFPIGVNVLYSNSFGFSYEFTPTIKAENGGSKETSLLFDPGNDVQVRSWVYHHHACSV